MSVATNHIAPQRPSGTPLSGRRSKLGICAASQMIDLVVEGGTLTTEHTGVALAFRDLGERAQKFVDVRGPKAIGYSATSCSLNGKSMRFAKICKSISHSLATVPSESHSSCGGTGAAMMGTANARGGL